MGAGETWQGIRKKQQVFGFQDQSHASYVIYDSKVYVNKELFLI